MNHCHWHSQLACCWQCSAKHPPVGQFCVLTSTASHLLNQSVCRNSVSQHRITVCPSLLVGLQVPGFFLSSFSYLVAVCNVDKHAAVISALLSLSCRAFPEGSVAVQAVKGAFTGRWCCNRSVHSFFPTIYDCQSNTRRWQIRSRWSYCNIDIFVYSLVHGTLLFVPAVLFVPRVSARLFFLLLSCSCSFWSGWVLYILSEYFLCNLQTWWGLEETWLMAVGLKPLIGVCLDFFLTFLEVNLVWKYFYVYNTKESYREDLAKLLCPKFGWYFCSSYRVCKAKCGQDHIVAAEDPCTVMFTR